MEDKAETLVGAFRNIVIEIEKNATEDTLFERMVLKRLNDFSIRLEGTQKELQTWKYRAEETYKDAEHFSKENDDLKGNLERIQKLVNEFPLPNKHPLLHFSVEEWLERLKAEIKQ